jgi:hypothetical protein
VIASKKYFAVPTQVSYAKSKTSRFDYRLAQRRIFVIVETGIIRKTPPVRNTRCQVVSNRTSTHQTLQEIDGQPLYAAASDSGGQSPVGLYTQNV